MKYTIAHEIKGRIRFDCDHGRYSMEEFDHLDYYFSQHPFITSYKIYERTGNVALVFEPGDRSRVTGAMDDLDLARETALAIPSAYPTNAINFEYRHDLEDMVLRRIAYRVLLPYPVRTAITLVKSLKYFKELLVWVFKHDTEIQVLDIAAVIASIATRQFDAAGDIIFLLGLGELLEDWTHKRSVNDLARSMSLNIDKAWVKDGDIEIQKPLSMVTVGERVVVHMGSVIPVDGEVESGEAMVNQASLTGEPLAVRREAGDTVFAGTVVEEGTLVVRTTCVEGRSRMDRIVKLIEDSQILKSDMQKRSEKIGNNLIIPTFTASALIYLFTRNVTKAVSVLMADYSCTLHLCMPIAELSAMRECTDYGVLVKGGKFLESVAEADTIIFDKTGTLTLAQPRVARTVAFGRRDEAEVLRIAACLEEHFHHSLGTAIVLAARERGVDHIEEVHGEVEYQVARGIVSTMDGRRVAIGSARFILEDEGVVPSKAAQAALDGLPLQYSRTYLAIGGHLAGVICIEDPLRPGVAEIFTRLRHQGITKIVMLTGDMERTASAIAESAGIDHYIAECLPEDKSAFIEAERAAGRKVIMVGDGINDTPALSASDVGIAMSEGAQIANEIADITVSGEALENVVILREISSRLMGRIDKSYRFVIFFNTLLIASSLAGFLTPSTTAVLHNVSAISTGFKCMGNLVGEDESIGV